MKLMTRFLSVLIIVIMLFAMVGCNNSGGGTQATAGTTNTAKPATTAPASTPNEPIIEREAKTLTILQWDLGSTTALPLGNNFWTEWIQENFADPLNITMEWQIMPRWEETTLLNVWMASQEAADLVYTYDINLVIGYISQGGLHDLTDPIAQYGNDMVEYVTEEVMSYGVFNGRQYAVMGKRPLPGIVGASIRGDWLDTLGLPVPTTTDEWYNTMVAFKEEDPGGVGDLVVPMAMGMQEIAIGYFNILYSFIDPSLTDKEMATIYPFNYPGYKDGVRFMNKCYNEGLLSPEFALDADCSKMFADIGNGVAGFFTHNVLLGYGQGAGTARFEILEQNVEGAYFVACDPFTNSIGAHPKLSNQPYDKFNIVPIFSNACEEVIMYLNWTCNDDVRTLIHYGAEGEDKAWHYGDNGLIVRNVEYTGDDRGASLFPLVNGWDYGSTELNLFAQTSAYTSPQAKIAYEYSLTDIRQDPWFFPYWKEPIVSEGKYSNAMIDKYKEMFTLLYMCSPAEFDSLYDSLVDEFMLMYGNEVCAERLAVWERTME